MPFFSWLYRNGIWISLPAFILGGALLAFFILKVIRIIRHAHIVSVPLLEQQMINFPEPGRVILCTQGPRLSSRFAPLRYELLDETRVLRGRTTWFHARTSGVSWVRREVQRYQIPAPGSYVLRITGLQPGDPPEANHKIVFMRPHLARSVGCIIGILLASVLFIGSIVLFSLRFTPQELPTLKTPIIVLSVITGVALLAVFGSRAAKRREAAERQFALAQGWSYTQSYDDPAGVMRALQARLEKVCPEIEFRLDKSMTVEAGSRSAFLFGCEYRVRDWGPKTRHGSACLILSERFAAITNQVDLSWRSGLDKLLLSHQVDLVDSEFSRTFIVTSKDPAAAKRLLNAPIQARLLERIKASTNTIPNEVNFGPGGVVVLTWGYARHDDWLALLDLAREIEAVFE